MKQSGEIATPYGLAMRGQYGRSMVEMLGVLAVMGVLSVAGIAGFKNAMDKNKANTIINEAQKRATLVVPQIQLQNSTNPTLNEFSNNNLGYATFDTKVYTKADNLPDGQFGIKVSGVNKEVCQNILNALGDNTVIRRLSTTDAPTTALTTCGETNTFLMVYNNDMTTNPVAGEFTFDSCPENFFQCSTTTSCVATENDCPTCESTYPGTINNGDGGFAGTIGSDKCYCENSGYTYNSTDGCQKKEGTECTSFKDCDKGEYCYFASASDSLIGSQITGTCSTLTSLPSPKSVTGIGKTWKGGSRMNWYSANDWCLAHGKKLVDVEDFDCYYTGTNEKIVNRGRSNWSTPCCESGKTCRENTGNISLPMKSARAQYGSTCVLTASETSSSSTNPFTAALDRQTVGTFMGYLSGTSCYPLCK